MSHRALLIGASNYDDANLSSLPFVRDDLVLLQSALTDRGFVSTKILEPARGITGMAIKAEVKRFLQAAQPGDTLLILLSGHGMHFRGVDYLIPEEADSSLDLTELAEGCVAIDWRHALRSSRASRVIFLIDACREGVTQDGKAPFGGARGWATSDLVNTLKRKVAYVYACSEGQRALYVRDGDMPVDEATGEPGGSFSLFSRAVSDIVSRVPHAMELTEFVARVRERTEELHAAYKKGLPQVVRLATEVDRDDFGVLPGTERPRVHPWVRTVEIHPVWDRTPAGAVRDTVRDICLEAAERLADGFETDSRALRDDPWHDPELAKRSQERMQFAVSRIEGAVLTPTEAALVALLPLVGQAFWTREAAQRADMVAVAGCADEVPQADFQADFQAFTQGHPRLVRRLRSLQESGSESDAAEHIRWWLFHRWLLQQPELYTGQSLKSLMERAVPGRRPDRPDWMEHVLSGAWLARFVQDLRTAPFAVPGSPVLPAAESIAASTADEHEVSQVLVTALAKTAHALAVDPVDLSEIVVEHIGISDSVLLPELLATLRGSDWRPAGAGRSLKAVCRHPAVQIALRQHAQRTDGLLRDINRLPSLARLHHLPPFADADLVRLSDAPEYLSEGIRFQLAEDRVQELLMGESLYGERELAIRELYQNALDALRYRDARTQYLLRTGTGRRSAPWTGEITFERGMDDDGRPVLVCRDNGIGMGLNELSRTFAQGGSRFVDLPEFVAEQAAWSKLTPKIELHPNSRFGIGVLSYFMLADEIEVITCRMTRLGKPGHRLKVKIPGPGNFFRIEDAGEGEPEDIGTEVRLRLTHSAMKISVIDTLGAVLWVSQYRTTAVEGARRRVWESGELDAGTVERHWAKSSERGITGVVVRSRHRDLWWVDGKGTLLADGLRVDTSYSANMPYGAIANLHGTHQPTLKVDRKMAISFDEDHVLSLTREAAGDLVRQSPEMVTPQWLAKVADSSLPLADDIAEAAQEHRIAWRVGDQETSFEQVGFFFADRLLLPVLTREPTAEDRAHAAAWIRNIPAAVLRWRLLALFGAGLGGPFDTASRAPVMTARPSDLHLVAGTYRMDDKLAAWLKGPGHSHFRDVLLPRSIPSGKPSLDLLPHWRSAAEPLTVTDLFSLVNWCRREVDEVAHRWDALDYRVTPLDMAHDLSAEDLTLLSSLPDRFCGPSAVPVSPAQIVWSADHAGRSTDSVVARLRELGYATSDGYPRTATWPPDDRKLLLTVSRILSTDDSDDVLPPVTRPCLLMLAHALDRQVRDVMASVRRLGLPVSANIDGIEELTVDDRRILDAGDGLDKLDRPVHLLLLYVIAFKVGHEPDFVAGRLRAMGWTVPDPPSARSGELERAARLLYSGLSKWADVPSPEEPLPGRSVAHIVENSGRPLSEVMAALDAFGIDAPGIPAFLSRFGEDMELLGDTGPYSTETVQHPELYAAAHHVGRPRAELAADLSALGYEIAAVDEEFEQDVVAEDLLERSLPGAQPPPALLPYPGGDEPSPRTARPERISLSALTAVAMRQGMLLRDVAAAATGLGLRHEAETWFSPG